MRARLDDELWLVERPDGPVLIRPILGQTPTGEIRVRSAAGGLVTVIPAGSMVEIAVMLEAEHDAA